jgi:hypothetical protein
MTALRWMAPAALALAALACAGDPSPVPVHAGPAGAAALEGRWTGRYESPALGRGGSIVFTLVSGRDTAYGDVVMVPRGSRTPLVPAYPSEVAADVRAPGEAQVLGIRFVTVEGDRVTGVLAPYTDPECECTVFTTFEGTVRGDRIGGTFTTRGAPYRRPAVGSWRVDRHDDWTAEGRRR